MMLGMCVLGAAWGAFHQIVFGSAFADAWRDYVGLAAFAMAFNMTVPMVLWMRYRGHSWERGGEMAVAMNLPLLPLLLLYSLDLIPAPSCAGAADDADDSRDGAGDALPQGRVQRGASEGVAPASQVVRRSALARANAGRARRTATSSNPGLRRLSGQNNSVVTGADCPVPRRAKDGVTGRALSAGATGARSRTRRYVRLQSVRHHCSCDGYSRLIAPVMIVRPLRSTRNPPPTMRFCAQTGWASTKREPSATQDSRVGS